MLTLNVLPICKARSIKEIHTFLTRSGFSHSTAHQIATGKATAPKLAHLEKLCLLLDCTPHDILEWKPSEGQAIGFKALSALLPKEETGFEWMQELKKLPLDKIRELGLVVKTELGKEE